MDVKALSEVLHKVVDALGGGHQHLHDDVDQALGTAPAAPAPPPPTDDELAAARAVLARAAAAAPAVTDAG